MRLLFALVAVVMLCQNDAYSGIIGDVFIPRNYEGKNRTLEKSEGKGLFSDRWVYLATSTLTNQTTIISVSKKTGRIFRYTMVSAFQDIHQAILFSSLLCEGTVHMPESASYPQGFILRNEPGISHHGNPFEITVSADLSNKFYTLNVECSAYLYEDMPTKKP